VTLRRRVLGYMALATIASCALTVIVAVVLVRHQVASRRLTNMEDQAQVLALAGVGRGARGPEGRVYRVGTGRPRRVADPAAAAILARLSAAGDAQGTIDVFGTSLLFVARQGVGGRIVLVRSARLAFGEWRSLLWSVVLAGLGGALLAALLSVLLARRLTRPIAALSQATGRLADGATGVAVPVDGTDELAQLGRSFNAMSSDLERARESQRQFLESASHELKTPLTSILGYADALQDGAVAPRQGAEVIAEEARRLQRLVQDLLELARVGRADFAVEREPADLGAVVRAAVDRHLAGAGELGVTLSADVADDADGVGDAERLLQATSNLIENALRVTPAGGRVIARATAGQITVSDTGPGLRDEELPRAFQRFYLYERYRTRRAGGSGLGLAIVSELLGAMGGTASAAHRVGGGTEFTLTVPTATPRSPARSGVPRPYA
jgi:two-component system OmpR family sensor kinase